MLSMMRPPLRPDNGDTDCLLVVLFFAALGSMALALAADAFGITPPSGFVPR